MTFTPADAGFESRVRASFSRQSIMTTLGATLTRIEPGMVEIALPFADHILQQHGFVHAGVVATIADSAAGYAGLTLMPQGAGVLTAEFKINLLAPAQGERLIAQGRVIKAGRSLTIAEADVFAEDGPTRKHAARLTATLMSMRDRQGVAD
ncbi:MAG: PaaI family thioesterase [Salinarimonas sp.]